MNERSPFRMVGEYPLSEDDPASPDAHPVTRENRERIGERFDELREERDRLKKELASFELRDMNMVFFESFSDDAAIRRLADGWMERMRASTDFFAPLDRLNIRLFTDDLAVQPGFPNEQIIFSSGSVRQENIVKIIDGAGRASRTLPRIELIEASPTLRSQLRQMADKGTLTSAASTLVHELVHRRHLRENPETDGILTEAQAYFSGLLGGSQDAGMAAITHNLTQSKSESGLYDFDHDNVVEALRMISALHGLGMDAEEMAALIVKSRFDKRRRTFVPMADVLGEKLARAGLDEVDAEQLEHLFRLHVINQRLKGQVLLLRQINETFPLAERRAFQLERIRGMILCPTYYDENGKSFKPDEQYGQLILAPANEEFPYDPAGLRTGIIFGYFDEARKSPDGPPEFAVGRYEASGTSSRIELATTDEEQTHLLEAIRQHAPNVSIEEKGALLMRYHEIGIVLDPVARLAFQALTSPEERREFVADLGKTWEETFAVMAGSMRQKIRLQRRGNTDDPLEKSVESYRMSIYVFDETVAFAGGSPADLPDDVADYRDSLIYLLDEADELLGKERRVAAK